MAHQAAECETLRLQVSEQSIELDHLRDRLNGIETAQRELDRSNGSRWMESVETPVFGRDRGSRLRPETLSALSELEQRFSRPTCRFLNPDASTRGYVRCAERPELRSCEGCSSYQPD